MKELPMPKIKNVHYSLDTEVFRFTAFTGGSPLELADMLCDAMRSIEMAYDAHMEKFGIHGNMPRYMRWNGFEWKETRPE